MKKTKTYAEVMEQIESLKAEASSLKQAEVADVIARIKDAIRIYDLTADDLGFGARSRSTATTSALPRKGGAGKKAGKGAGLVKFRDPDGNVWGGRGPRPVWLRNALTAGKSLDDFKV